MREALASSVAGCIERADRLFLESDLIVRESHALREESDRLRAAAKALKLSKPGRRVTSWLRRT